MTIAVVLIMKYPDEYDSISLSSNVNDSNTDFKAKFNVE